MDGNVNVKELPKRANGTCRLLAAAFFERLLSGQLELKNCLNSDVSAAQLDIRHLTLEQLLTIYIGAQDFTTASEHHHAHMNFLWMVNMHLFERLARQCVKDQNSRLEGELTKLPAKLLQSLGMKLTLLLGAGEILTGIEEGADLPSPLAFWVLQLEDAEWGKYRYMVFSANELQVELLEGDGPDLTHFMDCGLMSMVLERTAGAVSPRMLDLEITTIDPADPGSIRQYSNAASTVQRERKFTEELMDVVARRSVVAVGEVTSDEVQPTEAQQENDMPPKDMANEDASTESELELEKMDSENVEETMNCENVTPSDIHEVDKDVNNADFQIKIDLENKAPNRLDPQLLALCLRHLGYPDGDNAAWQKGLLPEVCLRVTGHNKVNGHRWYTMECQLVPCNGGEPTLEWSVRRRMVQLTDLHHLVKQELGDEYKHQFVATPFAKRFRPRGTTERLSSWCMTLAGCMSTGVLRPKAVGLILYNLESPIMSNFMSSSFPQCV